MNYLKGIFRYNEIPEEIVLCITVSKEGQPLESEIEKILKQYGRIISTVQFENVLNEQHDLVPICKEIKSSRLKTAVKIEAEDPSEINKKLFDILDYVVLNNGQIMKKDYCPLVDEETWVNV